jgi:hypothetical protein
MLGIVVRQSAVLEDRTPSLGEWREIGILRGIKASGNEGRLICSSFDHYSMSQRKLKQKTTFYDRVFLKSPGYSSTSSISRIIDAWVFSAKLFIYLFKRRKSIDFVVVSYPTPESSFVVSLFSNYMRVYVDVRDAWPHVFDLKGLMRVVFNFYCDSLFKFVLKRSRGIIAMSEAMRDFTLNYYRERNCVVIPNPLEAPSLSNTDMSEHEEYRKLIQRNGCTVNLFFAGTLNQQFDFKIIDETSKLLLKNNIKHQFLIAGSGSSHRVLEKNYGSSTIKFLGQLDKLACDEYSKVCDGFFCFYKDKSFKGHLTNKILDFLRFDKFIFHNLGNNFLIDNQKVSIGYNIDTAEELYILIEQLIKGQLVIRNSKGYFSSIEMFGQKIMETVAGKF